MLDNEKIKALLAVKFENDEIFVEGDGYHYQITVISDRFLEMSRVKRTQQIYQILNEHITSGALHALSIKPFTFKEWKERHNG